MGKGSKRRPLDKRHCSEEELESRWASIFNKEEEPDRIVCPKCGGDGWLWWFELDVYDGPANETGVDDTRYMCDACSRREEDECS